MKDPVCEMEVSEPPRIQTIFENKVYGFCNLTCLRLFNNSPHKYLNSNPGGTGKSAESKIKTFLPLMVVFAIVLGVSLGSEFYYGNWKMMRWMQNFMAAFFFIFGGLKLLNWKGFAEAYQTYDILAKKSLHYAYAYPVIEVVLGVAYLFRLSPFLTNLVTVIVMTVSSIGVAQALHKKQKIQCACLGTIFKVPMTKVTLMEDLLMGAMALLMLFLNHGF